ncbi:hypothetical protein CIB84_000217 [Bambusicola thoracicus]|uniref:Uncharacterized protein n=1 Tax=Bambusicola thoracicus TaxID=9083 RepID=A0A2P4TI59_BAMTH|nr:hypothetical protein CIB84_000217 [Bambusicola thoracicus]
MLPSEDCCVPWAPQAAEALQPPMCSQPSRSREIRAALTGR